MVEEDAIVTLTLASAHMTRKLIVPGLPGSRNAMIQTKTQLGNLKSRSMLSATANVGVKAANNEKQST